MKNKLLAILFTALLLTGCNAQQAPPSYDEMKKMMTDALQTEDGKKAIRQLISDPEFREQLILEQPEVKQSIEQTLLSKEGEAFWKKTFDDPKFSETFAKSMKEQQEEIMKKLMKDASFQKDLEDFFGQADMQKQLETIIKSSTMKEQYEKAIEETINSPLLQTKWLKLIKAAEDESKAKEKEKKKEDEKSGGGK